MLYSYFTFAVIDTGYAVVVLYFRCNRYRLCCSRTLLSL